MANARMLPSSSSRVAVANGALSAAKSSGPLGYVDGGPLPSGAMTIGAGCPARATVQVRVNGS